MDKSYLLNKKKIIVINSFANISKIEDALYIKSCKVLQDDHDYVAYVNTKPGELISMNVKFTNDASRYKGHHCVLIFSKDGVNASVIMGPSLEIVNNGFVIEYEGKEASTDEDKFKCGNCSNIVKKSELFNDGNVKCPYCEFGFLKVKEE